MRPARQAGTRAVLLECEGGAHAAAVAAELLRQRADIGADDVVAGATTVLVEGDRLIRSRVESAASAVVCTTSEVAETIEMRVAFDGPDLPRDSDELIAAFCARAWTVGFLGFAPGFGYLVRDDVAPDSPLYLPRRAMARPTVPAGSVALAAGFAAIYPRSSPGGWNLIGTIDSPQRLFNTETGALLQPGMLVTFDAR